MAVRTGKKRNLSPCAAGEGVAYPRHHPEWVLPLGSCHKCHEHVVGGAEIQMPEKSGKDNFIELNFVISNNYKVRA